MQERLETPRHRDEAQGDSAGAQPNKGFDDARMRRRKHCRAPELSGAAKEALGAVAVEREHWHPTREGKQDGERHKRRAHTLRDQRPFNRGAERHRDTDAPAHKGADDRTDRLRAELQLAHDQRVHDDDGRREKKRQCQRRQHRRQRGRLECLRGPVRAERRSEHNHGCDGGQRVERRRQRALGKILPLD